MYTVLLATIFLIIIIIRNKLHITTNILWHVLCKSRNLRSTKVLSFPCHLCAATSCQVLEKPGHVTKVFVPLKQQKITENFRASERLD